MNENQKFTKEGRKGWCHRLRASLVNEKMLHVYFIANLNAV